MTRFYVLLEVMGVVAGAAAVAWQILSSLHPAIGLAGAALAGGVLARLVSVPPLRKRLARTEQDLRLHSAVPYVIVSNRIEYLLEGEGGDCSFRKVVILIPHTDIHQFSEEVATTGQIALRPGPMASVARLPDSDLGEPVELMPNAHPSHSTPSNSLKSQEFRWRPPTPILKGSGRYEKVITWKANSAFAGKDEDLNVKLFGGRSVTITVTFAKEYLETVVNGRSGGFKCMYLTHAEERPLSCDGTLNDHGEFILEFKLSNCKHGERLFLSWKRSEGT